MSWPDVVLSVTGAGLLGALIFMVVGRTRQAQSEIDRLRRELAVYAEASTRVADTLDRALLGRTTPPETSHSSRRYLLSEAQRATAQGESLDAVAARLQLSHDEVHLLRYTLAGRSGATASAAASAAAGPPAGTARGRSWAA